MPNDLTIEGTLDDISGRIVGGLDCSDVEWWSSLKLEAAAVLKEAMTGPCTGSADRAWFLVPVCRARGEMASAFADINLLRYRHAWATLEQAELACDDLMRNPVLDPEVFEIPELKRSVHEWQSLFPYRLFISPEMIIKKERCSVCSAIRSPYDSCEHRLGIVYGGIMCFAEVVEMTFCGVSLEYRLAFRGRTERPELGSAVSVGKWPRRSVNRRRNGTPYRLPKRTPACGCIGSARVGPELSI